MQERWEICVFCHKSLGYFFTAAGSGRIPWFLVAFSPAMGEISSLGWNCISRGGEGAAPRGDAAGVGAPAELTPDGGI